MKNNNIPENVYVFSEPTLSRFDIADLGMTVYGWGFKGERVSENPLYDRHVDDISRVNIVCGYADLGADLNSVTAPIATADLKKFGADYYAFGSRHDGGEFQSINDALYGYCGAPESIGYDDAGVGGAIQLTIRYNDGELSMDAKNMTFGQIVFKSETIDITGVNNNNEIVNIISRLVSEKKYGAQTVLRVELTGEIDPRFIVPKNLGSDALGLYHFDLIDKTMPLYNTASLKRDMSVKGEVYRQLLPLLKSADEEERLTAARAFREALAALENREIDT
jgi:hypothetical protein